MPTSVSLASYTFRLSCTRCSGLTGLAAHFDHVCFKNYWGIDTFALLDGMQCFNDSLIYSCRSGIELF